LFFHTTPYFSTDRWLFIAITAICFSVLPVVAQKTVVSGMVFDATTNEPLPFVNITFQNSKIGTTSDIDGNYRIETYYATDSIVATFVGYKATVMAIRKDKEQLLNLRMETGEILLGEMVVVYRGNPAEKILNKVIDNKAVNNREKYDAYEYNVYNKVEFDLNNITEEFKERRIFKNFQFIFDNVDSTGEKPYLPMFMTESLSEFAYQRDPKSQKEKILATKVSGISSESVSQFLGDMYQNVNVYENYIQVFGKSFVSPIANFGLRFYKYYLVDSAYIDNKWCYKIEFKPRHKQEPVFEGEMWVNDTTYAIKKIDAKIADNVNINFVNDLQVSQSFALVNGEYWMLEKDQLLIDFYVAKNAIGIYGRKTTSYRDFIINQPRSESFYSGVENVVVAEDAMDKSEDFWSEHRHDTLSANEAAVYGMVDSLKKVPAFRTMVDLVKLVLTGYKELGWFEYGPYFKTYSFNPIEGHRFRVGGRTSDEFSETIVLNGYTAYGTDDERFKYGGWFDLLLSNQPRQLMGFSYSNDLEQLGQSQNALSEDNILSSLFRRNPNNKLTNVEEYMGYYEREWIRGFSNKVMFTTRDMRPLGKLQYIKTDESGTDVVQHNLRSSELTLIGRFAYKEKFVSSGLDRFSLGTNYPILEAQFSVGLKGFLNGEYDYNKVVVSLRDKFRFGTMGYLDWRLEVGKYAGTVPYPLLFLHNGNESLFYDYLAFNLMNYFEFASDEYASAMLTHHFDGYFLNKLPLFRKLKWREVISGKGVMGRLNEKHTKALSLPDNLFTLEKEPYIEASVGIENILKIFRIDALWRLSYLDNPNIDKFGFRTTFEIRF
jgi:hypothetical protein